MVNMDSNWNFVVDMLREGYSIETVSINNNQLINDDEIKFFDVLGDILSIEFENGQILLCPLSKLDWVIIK